MTLALRKLATNPLKGIDESRRGDQRIRVNRLVASLRTLEFENYRRIYQRLSVSDFIALFLLLIRVRKKSNRAEYLV